MRETDKMDICYLKGIGPNRAKLFNKLDVYTVKDLINFYPRTYINWADVKAIDETELDEICVIKATVHDKPSIRMIAGGKQIAKVTVSDDSGDINLTFFNNKYIPMLLKEGETYLFRAKVTGNKRRKEMLSPEFMQESKAVELVPIYHLTNGLTSKIVSAAVKEALKFLPEGDEDCIPDRMRKEYGLCHTNYALRSIHFPKDEQAVEIARKRLIFEEFLILQIGMRKIKEKNKSYTGHVLKQDYTNEFKKLLPFELTGAQKRAIDSCTTDLKKNIPMNRLLQGDVGSGKTAVAAALCYSFAKNAVQCAVMAPTEILAVQHFESFSKMLKTLKVELLTGSLTAKNKRELYARLENGEIDVLIGTHALISEKVSFKNLGLVITDEQHRFGVKQRLELAKKGSSPHNLVMSATPIPRTLALMVYGELDISVLDELPPGRQKIETYTIDSSKRIRAYNYIKQHLEEGRQAYIICPLIEEGVSDLADINSYKEFLSEYFDSDFIGVLHGKMKAKEKEKAMREFSLGEKKILLSTTVVEVGVDVPNAVIMLIENSEMHGLSALHQLRGRVGRGEHKSTCILISDAQNEEASERMKIMKESSDGFRIADADLRMRGPGDFFGKKQHGLPKLKIANMAEDMAVLRLAGKCADEILKEDKKLLNYEKLKKEISILFKVNNGGLVI